MKLHALAHNCSDSWYTRVAGAGNERNMRKGNDNEAYLAGHRQRGEPTEAPAHPPLPVWPALRRAFRCLTGANVTACAGAGLPEGKGRLRGEPRERERMSPLLARMLLMLAACNVVRATAVHVVLVRSGPHVAVG